MGLGRWLRAAGYDTLIISSSIDDEEIYIMAQADKRLLLTRDHHFLVMKGANDTVCYLASNSLTDCIHELTGKLGINWLYNPFSRCLVCNSLFVETNDPKHLEHVPLDVRNNSKHIFYCEVCQKLYWQGDHTEHMRQKLISWDELRKPNNQDQS